VSGVTYSPALKWSVIVLLPLTIGWKLAGKPENPVEIQNSIVEFLTKQQFDVSVTDETLEYMGIINARSRLCQLRVARVSPLGHEADLVRQASTTSDRTFYVFRGTVYPEQPVRLTVASYLWFRFLRELGLVSRVPPVLAVFTSCDAEQLPWSALGSQEPT
jgi:hypothetical protein